MRVLKRARKSRQTPIRRREYPVSFVLSKCGPFVGRKPWHGPIVWTKEYDKKKEVSESFFCTGFDEGNESVCGWKMEAVSCRLSSMRSMDVMRSRIIRKQISEKTSYNNSLPSRTVTSRGK